MNRLLVVDLCCKAGVLARGLIAAGFDVVGVDNEPQPNYPGRFVQLDVTTLEVVYQDGIPWRFYSLGRWVDLPPIEAIAFLTASPPCQFATALGRAKSNVRGDHANLIPFIRQLLQDTGLPYVIENVGGARKHLVDPVKLCGSHFFEPPEPCAELLPGGAGNPPAVWRPPTAELERLAKAGNRFAAATFAAICRRDFGRFERHRFFEVFGFELEAPDKCNHKAWPRGCPAASNRDPYSRRTVAIGQYGAAGDQEPMPLEYQKAVMGLSPDDLAVDPSRALEELSNAVPPAFGQHIGESFLSSQKEITNARR